MSSNRAEHRAKLESGAKETRRRRWRLTGKLFLLVVLLAGIVLAVLYVRDPRWATRRTVARTTSQDRLVEIGKHARNPVVRLATIERVTSPAGLIAIGSRNWTSPEIRRAVVDQLARVSCGTMVHVFACAAKEGIPRTLRIEAVSRLDDQEMLARIASDDGNRDVRIAAIKRLTRQDVLLEIAETYSMVSRDVMLVSLAAVGRLWDQELLAGLVARRKKNDVGWYALENLFDPELLHDSASEGNTWAAKRINNPATLKRLRSSRDIRKRIASMDINTPFKLSDPVWRKPAPKPKWREVPTYYTRQFADGHEEVITREQLAKPAVQKELLAGSRADRSVAVRMISDSKELVRLACTDKDRFVGEVAVSRLSDDADLLKVAETDGGAFNRTGAVWRIADKQIVRDLAVSSPNADVRRAAASRLVDQDVLKQLLLEDPDWRVRRAAVRRVTDQKALKQAAKTDSCSGVVMEAMRRINPQGNQPLFAAIARANTSEPEHRDLAPSQIYRVAVSRLSDQKLLAELVALGNEHTNWRPAMRRLHDLPLITQLARSVVHPTVRVAAVTQVTDPQLLKSISSDNTNDHRVRMAAKQRLRRIAERNQ